MKQKDIPILRKQMLEAQGGICLLCGKPIYDNPVLDHSHSSGRVRGVLHSSCNRAEGEIKRALKMSQIEDLEQLIKYWSYDNSMLPLHPKHKAVDLARFKRLNKPQMEEELGITGTKEELIKEFNKRLAIKYDDF